VARHNIHAEVKGLILQWQGKVDRLADATLQRFLKCGNVHNGSDFVEDSTNIASR
jgi:hypothetical protein